MGRLKPFLWVRCIKGDSPEIYYLGGVGGGGGGVGGCVCGGD